MELLTDPTSVADLAADPAAAPADGSPLETCNTDLAAALATLGIPRDPHRPLAAYVGEVRQVTFFFQGHSPCNAYHARQMHEFWHAPDLHRRQPRHALTYIRIAMRNRARLLDYVHGRHRVALAPRPGGQLEVLHLRQDPQGTPAPAPARAAAPTAAHATRAGQRIADLELAACLLAVGVPLDSATGFPVEKSGTTTLFHFAPASPCGAYHTAPLAIAWQDATWHARHPEHPFAYVSCAIENRRRLIRDIALAQKNATAVFARAGHHHYLPLNAPEKTAETFLKALSDL